jgi:hypothetical protein
MFPLFPWAYRTASLTQRGVVGKSIHRKAILRGGVSASEAPYEAHRPARRFPLWRVIPAGGEQRQRRFKPIYTSSATGTLWESEVAR